MTKSLANTVNFLRTESKKLEARQGELSAEHAEAESTFNCVEKCLKAAEKSDAKNLPATLLSTLRTELSKSQERREGAKAKLQECEKALSFLKKSLKGAEKHDA